MKIFVTGATGFVGFAVVKELINAGHQVVGLVRSKEQALKLSALGAKAHFGDVTNFDSIKATADSSDGIIHTAFNHDFSKFKENSENDRKVIEAFGEIFYGDDRPIVITSALGIMPRGRVVYEKDRPVQGLNPRIASEQGADEVAEKGIKISVIRLAPSVHGPGDHAFIPTLVKIAREKGVSVYQEKGLNYWPAVNRLDVAKLFRLAVEKVGPPGSRYHGAAEDGVPFREIAMAIADGLGIEAISMDQHAAAAHFGSFAHFASLDILASNRQTRAALNWEPEHPTLISDLEDGFYFK